MLKSKKKNSLIINNDIELGELTSEANGKGRKFTSRFIEAGVAHYEQFGDVLITKETLNKFIHTMVGCPVIIKHKDITDKNADKERVGVVSRVWYNDADGWFYCEGVIWDKQAIDLVKNQGWNVSCTYDFESDLKPLTHNGKKIDMEFTGGEFLHLALVPNPRYERANIVMNSKETVIAPIEIDITQQVQNDKEICFLQGLLDILENLKNPSKEDLVVMNALSNFFEGENGLGELQAVNEDHWITIGADEEKGKKGSHILVKDGETNKEATERKIVEWKSQKDDKKEEKTTRTQKYKNNVEAKIQELDKHLETYRDINSQIDKYSEKVKELIGDTTDSDKINKIIEKFTSENPEVKELVKKQESSLADYNKKEEEFKKLTSDIADEILKTDIDNLSKNELEDLKDAIKYTQTFSLGFEKREKISKLGRSITDKIDSLKYQENRKEITEIAGVKKGKPMTHNEADSGKVNPNFKNITSGLSFKDNCQSCVVCYQMRRKGFNVQTKGIPVDKKGNLIKTDKMYELAEYPENAWIDPETGKAPKKNICTGTTPAKAYKWLDENVKEGETYSFRLVWKAKDSGHIVTAYRENGELTIYDPQTNEEHWSEETIIAHYFDDCRLRTKKEEHKPFLIRTDNMDLNPEYADIIMEKA